MGNKIQKGYSWKIYRRVFLQGAFQFLFVHVMLLCYSAVYKVSICNKENQNIKSTTDFLEVNCKVD